MGRIGDLMDSINGILERDEDRLRRAAQVTAETKEKFWADVRRWEASRKKREEAETVPRARKVTEADRVQLRHLRYDQRLTFREIARIMKRSEASVRIILRRDPKARQAAAK